jgi:hypothetical protein
MAMICIRTESGCRLAAVTSLQHSERIISKMPAETKKPLEALRNAALTAAGLIMAAIPLALWVAWDQATLVLGLAASAALGLLSFVLYADTRATNQEQRKDSNSRTMEHLDDEFLSELSDMGPFVYHNRLSADSRFRRKMARLKKKLVSSNS